MSTEKRPNAGEWWQYNGVRVYVVGRKLNGDAVCEYKNRTIHSQSVSDVWQHLPDCDSWHWQPQSFPKYYLPSHKCPTPTVFHRRDSETKTVGVRKDGSEWNWGYEWGRINDALLKEITEAKALALLDKPTTDVEYDPKTFTSDWGPFSVQTPPLLPHQKRTPVRLYWYDGNVVARYEHSPPTDPSFQEIKFDPQLNITASGFYVEGPVK